MGALDLLVVASGIALSGFLTWFFFGPKKARQAELVGQVQEVQVTVKGGYSPDLIRVRQKVPLRIVFDRQESGDCTSRVVFPDFAVSHALPAFSRTTVELTPDRSGQFGFACGMNMIHGTLIVEPTNGDRVAAIPPIESATVAAPAVAMGPTPWGAEAEDVEAADRKAEIADLTRRVLIAAVLTAPVLLAIMADKFLPANGLTSLVLNRWVQLALITPVMLHAGWPIHRTGWLSLRHKTAEMNALITIGTTAAYGYSLLVTLAPALLPTNLRQVYFEAVGVIITLILLGRLLEARAKAGPARRSGS